MFFKEESLKNYRWDRVRPILKNQTWKGSEEKSLRSPVETFMIYINFNDLYKICYNAITFRKISTSPSTKTYATFENANKAFLHLYGDKDICYCVVKLDESNSENPKHFGRFIPVAIGYAGLKHGVHFDFYIVLQWNSI